MSDESKELLKLLQTHFPQLGAQPGLVDDIAQKAVVLQLPAGKTLLQNGSDISHIPLVVKGSIKVVRPDQHDHEVLLYHIQPGQSCAMTLASSLRREPSRIKALTVQPTILIGIPSETAYLLGRKYPVWFDFVLDAYSNRFDELIGMVESIRFSSLDQRLLKYLREKAEMHNSLLLHIDHQEIADDLGSARVVVSRMLKQFENQGLVQLFRGRIKILRLM
ncbi:MAG: Crp/Fnr family transcriptional regulator [Chitinophagales bacterium]|nr:Crp/Fnr family transcriptional regulator [Chitinophagales bacterium]